MRIVKLSVFVWIACVVAVFGAPNLARDFELVKLNEGDKSAPTLLLVGGIHGNEAGAYYATDVFLRHYKITKGSVWVVPVANPHSMFAHLRGMYGDMNRKFAQISTDDPDYTNIQRIKELLAQKEVDISIHLHDGSGYWRPTYEDKLLNQYRWGNCSVVDQSELQGVKYGGLEAFATQMVSDINKHILEPLHTYHVHNTHTKAKHDEEQLKALTFYSLSIGKPALTNEASKELSIPLRVYYHLLAIESLLAQLQIGYERDFELEPSQVAYILKPPAQMHIEQNVTLPLDSIRPVVRNFPLPEGVEAKHIQLKSESRVMGFVKNTKGFMELKYGFRTISTFVPEWRKYDTSLKSLQMVIDDEEQAVALGSIVHIKESLEFLPLEGYRVNIIGYIKPNDTSSAPNEVGVRVLKKDFIPRFSLDKNAQIYRAEVYRGEALSGMIILSFAPKPREGHDSLHATSSQPITSQPPKELNKESNADLAQTPRLEASQTSKETTRLFVIKSPKGVNLRSMPSTQGEIIAKLSQGTKVEVIESGVWSKIAWDEGTGFVISSSLMSVQDFEAFQKQTRAHIQAQIPLANHQDLAPSAQNQISQNLRSDLGTGIQRRARVKVRTAFVRLEPSLESEIIAKAPLGREMEIVEERGEWVKIHYRFQGREIRDIDGYVAKRLLHMVE